MNKLFFYNLLRYFFGILLITTGIGKLLDNRGFAEIILTYQFGLSLPVAMALGVGVSLLELWIGISILRNLHRREAAAATVVLHAGYIILAIVTNLRGLDLKNCGCFGVFWGRSMTWTTVVEDAVLLALAVTFYCLRSELRSRAATA